MQEQDLQSSDRWLWSQTAENCGVYEDVGGEEDEAVFGHQLGQALGGQEELSDNWISTAEGKMETGRKDMLERTKEM